MNAQGQKTGGRQKGTPNKLTASMKYLTKALFLNNYELLEESFQQCKPNERLNFYAKMQPYLCARETSNENGGEWIIGQNMEHESIKRLELDALYKKQQSIEMDSIKALSSFQEKVNEGWNNIKEQIEMARTLGMSDEKMAAIFENMMNQYTQQYVMSAERLKNIFEHKRISLQEQITQQEAEMNTITTESTVSDGTTMLKESHSAHSAHSPHPTEPATPTVPNEPDTTAHSTHPAEPTPPNEPTEPDTTAHSTHSTHPIEPASPTPASSQVQPSMKTIQRQQHIPFYTNLKQKRKLHKK